MDSPVARAILAALAESWPERADLERVAIRAHDPLRVVVSVWTSTPGEVIGHRGSTVSELKERLRAVVPDHSVELRVLPGAEPAAPGGRAEAEATADAGTQDVVVPDLLGMTVDDAHAAAQSAGFSLTTGDPDGVPITFYLFHERDGNWVVIGQSPLPGVRAARRSQIVVAVEGRGGGGESGDREPRVPRPPGGIARFEHDLGLEDLEFAEGVE